MTGSAERFYERLVLIRRFEEQLLSLFSEGALNGTTHACIGQEAVGVAVANNLLDRDVIVSNHRCHGHYLARTDDTVGLLAEIMGKEDGVCKGWGGSQHLCARNFYTNGILGSTVPVAAGMAFAEKEKGSEAVVVLFMGDGAFGQGVVYEAFNMSSLWSLPLLVVVENNGYAQSTPIETNMAGSLGGRAAAFGIDWGEITSNDVEELDDLFARRVGFVRSEGRPFVQVVNTYRLCAHSKSDDHRDAVEIEAWRERDPLRILGDRLAPETVSAAEKRVAERLAGDVKSVRELPEGVFQCGEM